ncbi:hypothetical protein [Ruminococcus sp. NK3A76]|uniref:hypothetical protein n=1 Tax=Ruminococcus sp. NK3A76 TaxID=877411 RepID=UPI00048D6CD8|nr:hypothetical protein [Ruminococcus sp. NK3A76]
MQSDEKSDCASDTQWSCGIALSIGMMICGSFIRKSPVEVNRHDTKQAEPMPCLFLPISYHAVRSYHVI